MNKDGCNFTHESKHEKTKLGCKMTLNETKINYKTFSRKYNVKVRNNESEIVNFLVTADLMK